MAQSVRLGAAAAAEIAQKTNNDTDENYGPNSMGQKGCSDKRESKKKRKMAFSLQDLLIKDTDSI